jgi:predicted dithiol-disulfide oxidoreductase (DUF899 family)
MGEVGFPGESAEYRAARDRLLEREIGSRRELESLPGANNSESSYGRAPRA